MNFYRPKTSPEILAAIEWLAEAEAARIWESPTIEERIAIWERVTDNGLRNGTDYEWGEAGCLWESDV